MTEQIYLVVLSSLPNPKQNASETFMHTSGVLNLPPNAERKDLTNGSPNPDQQGAKHNTKNGTRYQKQKNGGKGYKVRTYK